MNSKLWANARILDFDRVNLAYCALDARMGAVKTVIRTDTRDDGLRVNSFD